MKSILTPVITAADVITPYGHGLSTCWDGLAGGRTAIAPAPKFSCPSFITRNASLIPDLQLTERSRLLSMLAPALESVRPEVPADAGILLATTTGEIDLLEKDVLNQADQCRKPSPVELLRTLRGRTGVTGPGAVISAACSSSAVAVARAADMIQAGDAEAVLVVGCDAVSEFVFGGFSTLMALSPDRARPFDADRDGLTLGEAATLALVMHPDRARREKRDIFAEVCGWGIASDANHMTGPSRDGNGLAEAIKCALSVADIDPMQIEAVCAHGTGTVYNDAMEMKAFAQVFGEATVPVYSVKGGTGHTMGAAGLLEFLVSVQSLREGKVPPNIGCRVPDADARGWVTPEARLLPPSAQYVLSTNSGFGGVNSALVAG